MKARLHIRFHTNEPPRDTWAVMFCHQLDRAVSPLGTGSLVLGLVAAALDMNRAANYLMAAGLLFHLTVWFAAWLESVTRH
jgi:hypothetical protein